MQVKYDTDNIVHETIQRLRETVTRSLDALYHGGAHIVPWFGAGDPIKCSPLAINLRLLCQVANGELNVTPTRENSEQRGAVFSALEQTLDVLFPIEGHERIRRIPVEFYDTPLGKVCARCQHELIGKDNAITISEAARILYGTAGATEQARVARMIERHEVLCWRDPEERNPKRMRRVNRIEIMRLARFLSRSR